MKPNFALQFTHQDVTLLQRAPSGWLRLGAVRFDDPALDDRLAELREWAGRLAPDGVTTKLVLPAEEVRYSTVLVPGPTDEARRLQIDVEVERLTPYGLDELAYDWVIEGDLAMVALAARDVLAQIEEFADSRGFRPLCLVAAPGATEFSGEPFFGRTTVAARYLPAGEKVQGDVEPVRVTGSAPEVPRVQPAPPTPDAVLPATPLVAPATPPVAAPMVAAPVVAAPIVAAPVPVEAPAPIGGTTEPGTDAAPVASPLSVDAPGAGPATNRPGLPQVRAAAPKSDAQGDAPAPGLAAPDPARPAPRAPMTAQRAAASRASQGVLRAPDPVVTPPLVAPPAVSAAPAAARGELPGSTVPPLQPRVAAPGAQTNAATSAQAERFNGLVRRLGTRAQQDLPTDGAQQPLLPAQAQGSAGPQDTPPAALSLGDRPDESDAPPAQIAFATRRGARPRVVASTEQPVQPNPSAGGRIAVVPSRKSRGVAVFDTFNQRLGAVGGIGARRFQSAVQSVRGGLSGVLRKGEGANTGTARALSRTAIGRVSGLGAQLRGRLETLRLPDRLNPTRTPAQTVDTTVAPRARIADADRQRAAEAESLTIFGARRGQQSAARLVARPVVLAGAGAVALLLAGGVWFAWFSASPAPEQIAQGQIAAPSSADAPLATAPVTAPPAVAVVEPAPTADAVTTDPEVLLEQLVQQALEQSLPQAPAADLSEAISDLAAAPALAPDAAPVQAPAPEVPSVETAAVAAEAPPVEVPVAIAPDNLAGAPPEPDVASGIEPGADTAVADTVAAAAPMTGIASVQRLIVPATLPEPMVAEIALPALAPPPPPGIAFDLGPDGLVVATSEGALSPTGILVYAGRPAAVPGARPAVTLRPEVLTPAADIAPAPTADSAVVAPAVAVPDDTPRADPALAGFRPQPRSPTLRLPAPAPEPAEPAPGDSGSLVPSQPAEPQTDLALTEPPPSPGGVSLASLRPQQRPTDLVRPESELAAETAAEPEPVGVIAASLVPPSRPADLAGRVQAALAASQAPTPPPAAAPSAEPRIPTSASVADQATQTAALNLRRVSLIGVFGSASDRRALVRLSNGEMLRVQVGDDLDGGRVSAIGDSELRYTRGGQNQVLRIGESG